MMTIKIETDNFIKLETDLRNRIYYHPGSWSWEMHDQKLAAIEGNTVIGCVGITNAQRHRTRQLSL
jgi:hypothetical protein